jgi:hypothetical protein
MSRKHNTRHPERGASSYARKDKSATADRYGHYREGTELTADRLMKWVQPGEVHEVCESIAA